MPPHLQLKDGSTVGIIGGGPAGSFFAHFIQKFAREKGLQLNILLFEGRDFSLTGPAGCNMCAGVISHSLIQRLKEENLLLENEKIESNIGGYFFQNGPNGVFLKKPPAEDIYTVFRGNGPRNNLTGENVSFDNFLLEKIRGEGITVLNEPVAGLARSDNAITLTTRKQTYSCDLVCGAFGLNSPVFKQIHSVIPGYVSPESIRVIITEIKLGREAIKRFYGDTIFIYNHPTPSVSYATVIPKRDFITLNLMGNTDLEKEDLYEFFEKSGIRSRLPRGFELENRFCLCRPRVVVSGAKNAFDDRIVIVGDASYSRYYKNGIESAYLTSRQAAEAVVKFGIDRPSLLKGYYQFVKKRINRDNTYGKLFYRINDIISRVACFNHANMQIANSVRFHRTSEKLREILWIMFTGQSQYSEVARRSLNPMLTLLFAYFSAVKFLEDLVFRLPYFKKLMPSAEMAFSGKALGPLEDGASVAVVGGGPAGCAFAIHLKNLATERGIYIDVHLFEYKDFLSGGFYNQCSGILSPPIKDIIEKDLKLEFPMSIMEREIRGYSIHSGPASIFIDEPGPVTYSTKRILLDRFFLTQAIAAKVKVHQFRITDIDITPDFVMLYSEGMNLKADLVVGAAGLDDGSSRLFERATGYRQPAFLESMIIKHHLDMEAHPEFQDQIHAFLPRLKGIEFAGISPKKDHIVINIAGEKVTHGLMDEFLNCREARSILPARFYDQLNDQKYFKGRFPIGPASSFYGHRYVLIGDSAGLVRAFKGKGINSGIITGMAAAETVMNNGISRQAFHEYYYSLRSIVGDFKYGRFMRRFTLWSKMNGLLGCILEAAQSDPALKASLYASVAGTHYYKEIMKMALNRTTLTAIARLFLRQTFNRKKKP